MKTNNVLLISFLLLGSCTVKEQQPLTGSNWGDLRNGSAEKVVSSEITFWNAEQRGTDAQHFFDYEAIDGKKSLSIQSSRISSGRWWNRVNLKPWSVYKFTGWIKTTNIVAEKNMGAGIRLEGMDIELKDLKGTNDWTKIEYEFNTGNNDATIVSCELSLDGGAKGQVWFDNMNFDLISSEKLETVITIDPEKRSEPLSKYVYGQFIEHLGKCIYGGIWAEMIEDRKFYYTPGNEFSPWIIEGDKTRLSIDRNNPYVGELSPVLHISDKGHITLKQENLGCRANIACKGRIILKADKGIKKVNITLCSGKYKETISLSEFKPGYYSYQLLFEPDEFSQNASLEINGEGNGKLYLGTLSLMPEDNIKGFRKDVLALLKELDSPVYRWPGGNFVSGYNWNDGLGPRDLRPPRKNPAWTGVEHNDVGIHEFIEFCKLINTEPYIAVNAGLGGVEEARKQIEYCNGDLNTPMGLLRAKNGAREAWQVRWWSIGNEMYGGWQLGHMSTDEFVQKHNDFAFAMRSADPNISLVAVGNVGPWDKMIMAECSDNMDLISEHFYRQDWHGGGLMTHVKQIPEAIRHKAEAHRRYRKEIPGLAEKNIRICLDEYNYWYGPHIYGELGTRYFLRDALGIAAGMNEFARQSDMIFMANYAQTVNVIGCIKTNTTHSVMASTGQVLKLYRSKFGSIPIEMKGELRPLDIVATLNTTMDTLVISAVNPTWDDVSLDINIVSTEISGNIEKWTITGPDDMAYNEPAMPERVSINGPMILPFRQSLKIKPVSINIFRIPIKF